MQVKSIAGKNPKEIQESLLKSSVNGFEPTLAVVFISVRQDREAICKILGDKGISIFGATTAGEFTDKGVEKDSAAILLFDLEPNAFEIACADFNSAPTYNVSWNLGKRGIEKFAEPSFIISCSGIHQEGRQIVEGIVDASGTSTIIGGMAGNDTFEQTTVFSNGFHSHNGLIALIIDQERVDLKGQAVSGWKPIGTEKVITKSKNEWILGIDHQPALDVLTNFLGIDINTNTSSTELRSITLNFPFEIYPENEKPLLVPPLNYNIETRGILVPRGLPEGTKIKFTLPPDFDVINTVVHSARKTKDESMDTADALIIFSCIGRHMTLGPLVMDEINGLHDVWNVPMAGFFCFGEFGSKPGDTTPDFVGTTCSWVAMKEK